MIIATEFEQLASFRAWAEEAGLGLELQAFADPLVLAGDWKAALDEHKRLLRGFRGILGLHGAFYDMVSASPDPAIVEVTRRRYRQNLQAAAELGAEYIVFHVNYLGILKVPNYRSGWHQRQVDFWEPFAEEASQLGIHVLLENLWEDEPKLVTNILAAVDNLYLRACLDIAHATLFSDRPIESWIDTFAPYLHLCHLNNHDGKMDLHWPLDQGVIDYGPILARLHRLPNMPRLTLEMPEKDWIIASLDYYDRS